MITKIGRRMDRDNVMKEGIIAGKDAFYLANRMSASVYALAQQEVKSQVEFRLRLDHLED